jgi:hypothetical protein
MKWLSISLVLAVLLPAHAAAQYTAADCENLKQQQQQLSNRIGQGDAADETHMLTQREQELVQLIGLHCAAAVEKQTVSTLSTATIESVPVYTVDPVPTDNAAAANTVTVAKDFHKHFTWFGIAFVVFIAAASWIIWRK